jgi:hypothetical protein
MPPKPGIDDVLSRTSIFPAPCHVLSDAVFPLPLAFGVSRMFRPGLRVNFTPVAFVVFATSLALAGMAGSPASAAQWKKKQTVAAVQTPPAAVSGGGEVATGTVSPQTEGVGKDCFVVRKRALVPGTGYIIRKSTFCN